MKFSQIWVVLLLFCMVSTETTTIDDFKRRIFKFNNKKPGIYELDVGFDSNLQQWAVAFGDIDQTSYTDIILADKDAKELSLYKWGNKESTKFSLKQKISLTELKEEVISVFTVDMNNDRRNDIFIVLRNTESGLVSFKIAFQDENYSFKEKSSELFSFAEGLPDQQPVPFQLFDDNLQSLKTYIIYDDKDSKRKVGHVENLKVETKEFDSFISEDSKCQSKSLISSNKLSAIHGSVFIDLNMDCRPDLMIEATDASGNRIIETFFFQDTDKFCLVNVETFSNKDVATTSSSFSFLDLLRNGSNTGIMVDTSNNLHVFLNKYSIPNPSDTATSLCSGEEKLGNNKKHLPPFENLSNFGQSITNDYYFYTLDYQIKDKNAKYHLNNPKYKLVQNILKLGDFDLDGYPDLLFNVQYAENTSQLSKTVILQNSGCDSELISQLKQKYAEFSSEKCRHFQVTSLTKDFAQVTEDTSYVTTFFDWGEMGNYGILQVRNADNAEKPQIKAYFNYLNKENYFLKAAGKSHSKSSGDPCIGCSFQALKTEIDGTRHPIVGSQSYGVTFTRLSLPYTFLGLDRTNNYIENFNFGVAKNNKWSHSWSPIIPNSQLLLSANHIKPENWGIEIFINPTDALWLIIVCTVSVLLILGLVIIYFHWQEKQADRRANEQNYSIF